MSSFSKPKQRKTKKHLKSKSELKTDEYRWYQNASRNSDEDVDASITPKFKARPKLKHSKSTKKDTNPYLDASVLTKVDNNNNKFSLDMVPDDGMDISPLTAKDIFNQLPWKKMDEYGLRMEWNMVIHRDTDNAKVKLEKDNKRLMERIKTLENRVKEQEMKNNIDIRYNFDGLEDNIIILRSENNRKSLIVKAGKLQISRGFIGFEIFTKWKLIQCGNAVYQFQNCDNNKFMRIFAENESGGCLNVDVNGDEQGLYSKFRIHLIMNTNVVILESLMFSNKYLVSNIDGNVYIDDYNNIDLMMNNKECMFQILMENNDGIIKYMTDDTISTDDDINDNISSIEQKESTEDETDDISSSDDYNVLSENDTDSSSSDISDDDEDEEEEEEEDEDEDNVDIKDEMYDDFEPDKTSKFNDCWNEKDVHLGGISCIAVSPKDYKVITGGEHDSSLRIWEPKQVKNDKNNKLLSEIQYIPKHKANVDGTVFSVNISDDGVLIAAGCSWQKSQNGYVVVWNMNNNGKILCDLKSKSADEGKGPIKRGRHSRSMSLSLNTKDLMRLSSTKKVSATNLFQIKRTDSVSSLRFGVVHCVKLMKFKSKRRRLNYLLFGGDTTGCVLCWNLSLKNKHIPVCRINAGNDVIYDLAIINNKYLFSVSHDKSMRYCNIKGLRKNAPLNIDEDDDENKKFEGIDTMQIYKDPEYALHSIAINRESNYNKLIFGSRKCCQFGLNKLVLIRHKYKKYLSVKRGKKGKNKYELTGNADSTEIKHKSTKWNIEYLEKNRIRLRSRKSGKYLRIYRNGYLLDVEGNGKQKENQSIFIWNANEKTLQSFKYPKFFIAVNKENNSIISVEKHEVNKNIAIEFSLFDANKTELNVAFKSFFDYIYEPPQDLDRICNLKIRQNLLCVQRSDINHIKIFDLDINHNENKNVLLKRFKIGKCECNENEDEPKSNIKPRRKSNNNNNHVFRIYDSGISFNQKYIIFCVGIFQRNNLKKAVAFSLKGFKIPKSPKKSSSYTFCPQ